jgi:hypothetical protein
MFNDSDILAFKQVVKQQGLIGNALPVNLGKSLLQSIAQDNFNTKLPPTDISISDATVRRTMERARVTVCKRKFLMFQDVLIVMLFILFSSKCPKIS